VKCYLVINNQTARARGVHHAFITSETPETVETAMREWAKDIDESETVLNLHPGDVVYVIDEERQEIMHRFLVAEQEVPA
jgi:hypothetical protein